VCNFSSFPIFVVGHLCRFPSVLWDSLPHAGASQVHPHVHGLLDDKQYVGAYEELHQSSKKYYQEYGRYLWQDFILIHKLLGLTVEEGRAVAVVPVVSFQSVSLTNH